MKKSVKISCHEARVTLLREIDSGGLNESILLYLATRIVRVIPKLALNSNHFIQI